MAGPKKKDATKDRVVAQNRKARHDYTILETFECGLVLKGTEVKVLRDGKAQLREAYARVRDGEAWLLQMHIPPYANAAAFVGHDPDRERKLLLHRRQINELAERTSREALTLVPLSIYFKEGKAKVELGLAKGRRRYDKRQAIAERDAGRDADRAVVQRRRSHSRAE